MKMLIDFGVQNACRHRSRIGVVAEFHDPSAGNCCKLKIQKPMIYSIAKFITSSWRQSRFIAVAGHPRSVRRHNANAMLAPALVLMFAEFNQFLFVINFYFKIP